MATAAEEAKAAKEQFDALSAQLREKLAEVNAKGEQLDELIADAEDSKASQPEILTASVEQTSGKTQHVERKVLADAIVVALDDDGKKVQRYERGQLAKIRPDAVEYLESIHAIASESYTDKMGYPSVLQQVLAANRAHQAASATLVDSGEVAQAEEDALDDGGKGSDETRPPTTEQQVALQNA